MTEIHVVKKKYGWGCTACMKAIEPKPGSTPRPGIYMICCWCGHLMRTRQGVDGSIGVSCLTREEVAAIQKDEDFPKLRAMQEVVVRNMIG